MSGPVRALVFGGREYADRNVVFEFLDLRHRDAPFSVLIHGGARGADTLAGEWAKSRGVPVEVFPANWGKHGKAAGPIRNQQMLDEGKPTMAVYFRGGRGTADMLERALKAGLRVWTPIPNPFLPHQETNHEA